MSSQDVDALTHKERLLRQGMKLFYAQGFHGTTVDAILASAEVPKGSFYHHFGSKDVFGQAVLDRYMQFQIDLFHKWAVKKNLSTSAKLVGYFKSGMSEYDSTHVYVPLEQSFLISRYVGVGKKNPPLSALGDGKWAKAKKNAEKGDYWRRVCVASGSLR